MNALTSQPSRLSKALSGPSIILPPVSSLKTYPSISGKPQIRIIGHRGLTDLGICISGQRGRPHVAEGAIPELFPCAEGSRQGRRCRTSLPVGLCPVWENSFPPASFRYAPPRLGGNDGNRSDNLLAAGKSLPGPASGRLAGRGKIMERNRNLLLREDSDSAGQDIDARSLPSCVRTLRLAA